MIPVKDRQPIKNFPIITILIIAINTAIFVYIQFLTPAAAAQFIHRYSLIPTRFRFYDLVTSQFIHGGIAHIFFNMLFLVVFAPPLENYLGRLKFLGFYLLCGIVAGLSQFVVSPGSSIPIIGASGAIAGVLGGHLFLFPQARIKIIVPIGLLFPILTFPAVIVLLYWIGLQLILGFSTSFGTGGVAYFAHIGGFSSGILLAAIERASRQNPS